MPLYREIVLDELGAWTFRLCDGKKRVKEIIEEFTRKYNLNPREAEVSIIEYLRQLARRNLIGFAIVSPVRNNPPFLLLQENRGDGEAPSAGQAFRSPEQSEGQTSDGVKEEVTNDRTREDNRTAN